MKRLMLLSPGIVAILLLCLVGALSAHSAAQPDERWLDGCHPRAVELMLTTYTDAERAAGTPAFDYAAACQAYRACDPGGNMLQACQLVSFGRLIEACSTEDMRCRYTALLYAAVFQSLLPPFGETTPRPAVIDGIPAALRAFRAGDDAAALEAYRQVDDTEYVNPMLLLSRGVVLMTLDRPAEALTILDDAERMRYGDPLTHYARALAYNQLGNDAGASVEALWLAWYGSSFFDTLPNFPQLQVLDPDHPLLGVRETWVYYPMSSGFSDREVASHLSQLAVAGRPVRVARFDAVGKLVIADLMTTTARGLATEQVMPLILTFDLASNSYVFDQRGVLDDVWAGMAYTLSLTSSPDVYLGADWMNYGESLWEQTFLLAREGSPDPRADLRGERCGAWVSLLRPGMPVSESFHTNDEEMLFDAPGGTPITTLGTGVVMVESVCIDGVLWWQIRDTASGVIGWGAENGSAGLGQRIIPAEAQPQTPIYCPGALNPRLIVGLNAEVVRGLGAAALRAEPSISADVLANLPEGALAEVGRRVVCADGSLWWRIVVNGVEGWMAEGSGTAYWLAPALEADARS
jgi:hypothetical protein